MSPGQSTREELTRLIERFDTGMLVTVAEDRSLHSRPMAIAGHDEPLSTVYFVTDSDSPKVREISVEQRGLVSLQGSARYVSLTGELTFERTTRTEIESLWSPKLRVWFSETRNPRLWLCFDSSSTRPNTGTGPVSTAERFSGAPEWRWRPMSNSTTRACRVMTGST